MLILRDAVPADGSYETGLTLRRLLLAVGVAIVIGVIPFLSGLVGSMILYTIAHSSFVHLSRRVPPRVAALTITIGALLFFLIPGAWLVSTTVSEARDAIHEWKPDQAAAWLSTTPLDGLDVTKQIAAAGTGAASWLSSRAVGFIGSAATMVLNVLIALLGLYYLLLSGDSLWTRVKRILPVPHSVADMLAARFATVTNALLLGTVLTAALQGTLIGAGFALLGLRPAVLWGFVTACVSVLPLFGSALVWAPGIAVLLLDHRPGPALFLAVLGGGIVSNLDNLVRLIVYRRVSGIHPMATIVGAFAGVRLFGVIGAFIGPLILSYFIELLGIYEDTAAEGDSARQSAIEPLASRTS